MRTGAAQQPGDPTDRGLSAATPSASHDPATPRAWVPAPQDPPRRSSWPSRPATRRRTESVRPDSPTEPGASVQAQLTASAVAGRTASPDRDHTAGVPEPAVLLTADDSPVAPEAPVAPQATEVTVAEPDGSQDSLSTDSGDTAAVTSASASLAAPTRGRRATRVPLLTRFARFVDAPRGGAPGSAVEQLSQTGPTDKAVGWIVTLVITAIAFFLRWFHLGEPAEIMFDETYYAKDAWSLLQMGYEGSWPGEGDVVNHQVATGNGEALNTAASWAVHPEVGKWLIAIGEKMFGLNAFGWRFMALVFGTALVFLVIRLARRLSRSTLIGGLAGLLLCVDGLAFVMSRIALLDVFQAVFILAGVSAVVADRDYFRNRLAEHIAALPGQTLAGRAGPYVFRPWLLVAGLMFGLGCATKWNTLYPMAVFGLMIVVWTIGARRLAGAGRRRWWALLKDGVPAFVSLVVVAAGVYLASWIPWLRATGGYDRGWGAQHPDAWVTRHFGEALASLWQWHVDTYNFHTGDQMANATHSYSANPWGWPVVARTIGIYAQNGIQPGDQGCTAPEGDTCLRVITGLGTPLLWWAACLAIIAALVWWLAGTDWRFGVVVLGMASTWVPWMFTGRGALFSFYGITMIPFMVIALAMALGVILGPAKPGPRRQSGAIVVGAVVALIVMDFAFIYPVLTGELMTRQQWLWRMWLPGWI